LISDRVSQDVRIVIYNGSVGPDHGLDTAIRSMPEWPKDSVFVIKGHAHLEYAEEIKSLARSLGLDDRVIMLKRSFRSFEENYGIIAGADVGWTVLEPAKENWKYSALASNKRFECMALGVPQITDNNPGVAELIEGNECGICIQPDSVSAASDAVKRLLSDASLRDHMTECGRRIHLGRFNYDQQFAPILEKLNSVVDAPRS
jgi:glycosyltransferase involved in cell wall biosynthesis